MYTLINPRLGERKQFTSLAEMINYWVTARNCVMVTVGLSDAEADAINNIYALSDSLRDSQRARPVQQSARRVYACDETAVP